MTRPSKHLDAVALETWAQAFQPEVLDEWECIPVVECSGFWRWLECTNPNLLDDFAVYWRGGFAAQAK